jgi:predicted polyphosphate/ATP-dependent NAD kinase
MLIESREVNPFDSPLKSLSNLHYSAINLIEELGESKVKFGFLINPIAGMGGKVGLKGTDNIQEKAVRLGAKPVAPQRGIRFLKEIRKLGLEKELEFVTCPKTMGEQVMKSAGLNCIVLPMEISTRTSSEDTKEAVQLLMKCKVDLILFVGGDGTARDILDGLKGSKLIPVLGIPSGVKMYSGIFAVNPDDAAHIADAFLKGETQLVDYEIIDADEEAVRSDNFNIRLYGFLRGPFLSMRVQRSKQVSQATLDEQDAQAAIARCIVEEIDNAAYYILGPGTTVNTVTDFLGVEKTLLGVDIYHNGKVSQDVNENKILREISDWEKAWIIVSPIGRQGIIFGRGNQQISPRVIELVGKEKIIVIATLGKLQGIGGGFMRVDTGDTKVDDMLKGFIRVTTDYREWRMLLVK